ncbi:MAG: ribonuclease Z, partial [Pricia sp.]
EPELIFEDEQVSVTTIPLDHRIYTNGFLICEKLGERKLDIKAVARYKIDKAHFRNIKKGKNVKLDDGRTIPNSDMTFDPLPPKSYAYCSDTGFNPAMVEQIKNVDALYHESTFLESEARLAPKTKHCTAKQAATIAKAAEVGTLVLGHYSTRYKSIEPFKKEAKEIFQNTELGDDGKVFDF